MLAIYGVLSFTLSWSLPSRFLLAQSHSFHLSLSLALGVDTRFFTPILLVRLLVFFLFGLALLFFFVFFSQFWGGGSLSG